MRGRFALVIALCGIGCYAPGGSVRYTCTGSAPICPSGQSCDVAHGCCTKPGESGATACEGFYEVMDGGTHPGDMPPAPVDQAPTLPTHCQYLGGSKDWVVCRGAFQPGEAASRCAAGYTLSSRAMPAEVMTACTDGSLGGSAGVDIPVWHNPASVFTQGSCSLVTGWEAGFVICGAEQGATATIPTCSGWGRSIVLSKSSAWRSVDGTLRGAANGSPNNGVICSR